MHARTVARFYPMVIGTLNMRWYLSSLVLQLLGRGLIVLRYCNVEFLLFERRGAERRVNNDHLISFFGNRLLCTHDFREFNMLILTQSNNSLLDGLVFSMALGSSQGYYALPILPLFAAAKTD